MSTYDVPGKKKANADVLDVGCWAEHDDGSLILVEGFEGGRVIYSIFDMAYDPPVEYRDAMPEDGFKDYFSWDDRRSDAERWLWHDKTAFPWDRVMEHFKSGPRAPSGLDQLSAAQRVARRMSLRGVPLIRSRVQHRVESVGRRGHIVIDKIQRALGELRR